MDCSSPGSSTHGIFPARILKLGVISSSRDLPDPGIKPQSFASPALAGGFFTTEPPWKLYRKVCIVRATVFLLFMYGCERWTIKKAECLRIDAFELWCWRTLLRVPWTVSPKGNKPWILIGRTDAEAETPILWALHVKNWLIGKDPNAGKDWKQEDKGTTEDEMFGWHHWLSGHSLSKLWELVMDREA